MEKTVIALTFAFFTFVYHYAWAAPEFGDVDLFDMERGKPIWSINNSQAIQKETLQWISSISCFYRGDLSELNFKEGEYCLRIPTYPIRVENDMMNVVIQDVYLYLGDNHAPILLLFDVNWPKRYAVQFRTDVRPFIKELGIWAIVKSKIYSNKWNKDPFTIWKATPHDSLHI
ncbi:hypothetical protein SD70_22325 [Gordoniibacillus kamchatkensis]|uniref:Uncharacterized protein n=1 Tax=Gordoniibacillus kamchatkensis TaxID=1590651 RepID=A0ABR5AE04_9BACL|nr:hypothetical protein [Paenibacillus sp. VKM B-2647]KIL39068.1 hypothetical protein SD70_22325 [Paenibacillus sp. VKM B-2647]